MLKKILVLMVLSVFLLSSVASTWAAYEALPKSSTSRSVSIFNDPYYDSQEIVQRPTSSMFAQRILSRTVDQRQERTLSGALLFSKTNTGAEPVVGIQPTTQRKLSEDPEALRLLYSTSRNLEVSRAMVRLDTSSEFKTNTLKGTTFQDTLKQDKVRGRVIARQKLYNPENYAVSNNPYVTQGYMRLLKDEIGSYDYNYDAQRDGAQRLLKGAYIDKMGISVVKAQRSLLKELGVDKGTGEKISLPPTNVQPTYNAMRGHSVYPDRPARLSSDELRRLRFFGIVPTDDIENMGQ